jgi:hypothetical protein
MRHPMSLEEIQTALLGKITSVSTSGPAVAVPGRTFLLGAAAQRADLSVLPLPDSLKLKGGALAKVLDSLRNRGLIRVIDADGGPLRPRVSRSARRTSWLSRTAQRYEVLATIMQAVSFPAIRSGRWKISPSALTADPAIPIFMLSALRAIEC